MAEDMGGFNKRSMVGIIFAVLIVAFGFSHELRSIYSLPPHMRIMKGEAALFDVSFPLTVTVSRDYAQGNLKVPGMPNVLSRPVSLETSDIGESMVEFRLFGIIPVRTVEVEVLPSISLIPGGHSIGVVLHSQGVIVVGNSPVLTQEGQYVTPAKDAGVVIGDVILSINGIPVQSDIQVAEVIDSGGKNGQPLNMLIKRGEEQLFLSVPAVMCNDTKRYRVGLFVRDSTAGVGTLTFYEPRTATYGAVGHIITDSDTNQPINCDKGKIVLATVSGIQYGKRGQPGEKIGVFIEEDQLLGNIANNTSFGIYGQMSSELPNPLYPEAIPVASMSQVQTGEAEILTVVDGQTIERFTIEIQKINLQETPESKGLVIKVTDPRLLEKTGGIVQGMSGSPILQHGKVVGAVTHVFVHDPTKGYGCFVDWMLMESGLIPRKTYHSARNLFTFRAEIMYN